MTTKRQLFAQLGCLYTNEAEAMRWFGEVGRYRLEQAHELQRCGGKPMSTDTSTDGIFWKDDNG